MALTLAEEIAALRIANVADDELRNTLEEIKRLMQLLATSAVEAGLGVLDGPLTRDGEQTVDGHTVNGYLVKENWQAPSGKRTVWLKIGATKVSLSIDDCLEAAPSP